MQKDNIIDADKLIEYMNRSCNYCMDALLESDTLLAN